MNCKYFKVILFLHLNFLIPVQTSQIGLYETQSENLFFNLGHKKKLKDSKSKLENAILKSKVEILGEIFKKHVDNLKKTENGEVELIFLVDGSSSVGEENFKSELRFVRKLLADFTVGPNNARVAVITFATDVKNFIDHLTPSPNVKHEKCSLLHTEIPSVKYSGGNTFTLGALLEAQKIFNYSRPSAKKAIFLITDGFSNNGYPIPAARALKENGVTIFTFGIRSGNIEELYSMSSKPEEEHSFLVESFTEFEAVARRALHKDLKTGSFLTMENGRLCDALCNKNNGSADLADLGCCVTEATCSCGTLTGHFVCLCPPGHYGNGLIGEGCHVCPRGTYNEGRVTGDISICKPCPDLNQNTSVYPATSIKHCVCKENFVPVGTKCEVVTCPHLEPPKNGYFVKESCSNVLNAACGVRCKIGFVLHGSSVRLCLPNGTWSGTTPQCLVKRCEKPKPVANGEMKCVHETEKFVSLFKYDNDGSVIKDTKTNRLNSTLDIDHRFIIDTVCSFSCSTGFNLVGSTVRTCLPLARWDGLQTTCKPVLCPALHDIPHGTITPQDCTSVGRKLKFGTTCHITCDQGYQLKGPNVKICNGKYGTWSDKNIPNKCNDITPPRLHCPQNKTLLNEEGEKYAKVLIEEPSASDNGPGDVVVTTKPIIENETSVNINIGETRFDVIARDAAGNVNSCFFTITILDKEAPQVFNCESPQIFIVSNRTENFVEWIEPNFLDNSSQDVTVEKTLEFGRISIGSTKVMYTGFDNSGNNATCSIELVVLDNLCEPLNKPMNAVVTCTQDSNNSFQVICELVCNEGFELFDSTGGDSDRYLCITNNTNVYWKSLATEMDFDILPDCSEKQEITGKELEGNVTIETSQDVCADEEILKNITKELQVELNNFITSGDDNVFKVLVEAKCNDERMGAEEEKTNELSDGKRKKKSIQDHTHFNIKFVLSDYKEIHSSLQKNNRPKLEAKKYLNLTMSNESRLKVKDWNLNEESKFLCQNGSLLRGDHCVNCPIGTFYNFINIACEPCPLGEYQHKEGQLSCIPCMKGFSTRKLHSRFPTDCKSICKGGTFGKAKKQGLLGLSPCTPCPKGYYQPLRGKTSCQKCPLDTSTIKLGTKYQTDCKNLIEIDQILNPCLNFSCGHGVCKIKHDLPYCVCSDKFIGSRCLTKLDVCGTFPCYNSGHCRPLDNDYICICRDGYYGKQCQFEINFCESSPCQHNSTCISLFGEVKCVCPPGFAGQFCEININECELLQPCQNGAMCEDGANEFACACKINYTGKYCDVYKESIVHSSRNSDENCKTSNNEDRWIAKTSSTCDGDKSSPPVRLQFPNWSTTNYIMVDGPDEPVENITICLWMQTTDNFNYGTLFSYAVHEQDNAFTLTDYNGFVLYVNGKYVITDLVANDGLWHQACVSWSSLQGTYHIYLDGVLQVSGHGLSTDQALPPNGLLVFGQEQDSFGGDFNEIESFVGKMFDVQIWNSVLDHDMIKKMYSECLMFDGTLLSWNDIIKNIRGGISVENSTFCMGCDKLSNPNFRGSMDYIVDNEGRLDEIRYKCDPGYVIRSQATTAVTTTSTWSRKCTKQGEWRDIHPMCTRVNCGFPGYFLHGTMIGRSYQYTDIIKYSCDKGYQLVGSDTRICQSDGLWSGDNPYCKNKMSGCEELTVPEFGSMFVNTNLQIEFVCDEGYELIGETLLNCVDNQWSSPKPSCQLQLCPSPKLEKHSFVANVTTGVRMEQRYFKAGDEIKIKCLEGYEGDNSTKTCMRGGVWSGAEPIKCRYKSCRRPNHPQNGFVIDDGRPLHSMFYEDEVIKYSCRHGYVMLGDETAKCLSNGTWFQTEKTVCQPVRCPPPPNVNNTQMLPANKTYVYGNVVLYRCLHNFTKQGDLFTRCEADGTWSVPRSSCEKKLSK